MSAKCPDLVQIVDNPIILHKYSYIVTRDNVGHDLMTELEPSALRFEGGVWRYKVRSVFIDNFSSKVKAVYSAVFDIKTDLNYCYTKRTQDFENDSKFCHGRACLGQDFVSFTSTPMTIITVPCEVGENGFCFYSNQCSEWFHLQTRPFNHFKVKIELKAGMPTLPKGLHLRFEVDYLFQRVK